ncbi:hypothetical protein VOLCADRAFT_56293 [Volvox carteri f. nagariensis]|uniref:Inositol hexakisphosphate and diphosphoinositol-pentakisphosphate kinase n=1 Tax=Volvox carteri f. nagariensis TaxID=3068 RepID=D8TJY8_VOLCA|nr:uncharacterized protein VOLCADRAFT_56293 [Volvox carteri f. nagariensis]EFJ51971.1 hypothetical protein VOLCADRAFT_56293 [Volvox carteri f. nagariensis]|eukprot:XP_002946745.1 hypothetical protein VOLCADRAFT_56293 [Volvox carteri f. nagariensis]
MRRLLKLFRAATDGHANLPKIRIGVCAMDKKARSKPMKEILERLTAWGEFEVVIFGDDAILEKPIEDWPHVECLLCWHSDGFPLKKAQEYIKYRRPFLVNDVFMQDFLLDRRKVYKLLVERSIPVPTHIIVERDHLPEGTTDPPGFVEDEDYVELNGQRIVKPFVEKPVSGEDHNIWVYYPHSMGGGVKYLFRKVDDKASKYDSSHDGKVRRDGSYIYEEFLPTGGTDVKVYTVGPRYAHAEARKSPVVDGKVLRNADGKEMRFPVLLSPQEKEIARMVCLAFGQKVCGFDLLRSEKGRSYVCDVNGWSFVKNSKKYYDDAADILRSIILSALAPHRLNVQPNLPTYTGALTNPDTGSNLAVSGKGAGWEGGWGWGDWELRCVLAVIRHGDRTPKQKLKVVVTQEPLLNLFHKYKDAKGKQAKLKSPLQMQELLDITRQLVKVGRGGNDEREAAQEVRGKLRIMQTVLESGGQFSGINRKVQIKPLRWGIAADGLVGVAVLEEALLILKWGGVLTHAGRQQAEDLGKIYRMVMYPSGGNGLLRLHSTYRHDLKIYSSDEGRVQTSAAAFTKAMLDLEGNSLTPILVSLVNKDASMLEAFGKGASDDIADAKEALYQVGSATSASSIIARLPDTPLGLLRRLVELLRRLIDRLRQLVREEGATARGGGPPKYSSLSMDPKERVHDDNQPCGGEKMLLMFDRWHKLLKSFYNEKKDRFDISKVPDIYDSAKYDAIHNAHLGLDALEELYIVAKLLADVVIPCEYGLDPGGKLRIGSKIANELLGKLLVDLASMREESIVTACMEPHGARAMVKHGSGGSNGPTGREGDLEGGPAGEMEPETETIHRLCPTYASDINSPLRHVRTRIYFTSESHMHSLVNVLRWCHLGADAAGCCAMPPITPPEGACAQLDEMTELDYLTQVVFRMYENKTVPVESQERFRVEVLFSPGANYNPFDFASTSLHNNHVLPIVPRTALHKNDGITLAEMEEKLMPFSSVSLGFQQQQQ